MAATQAPYADDDRTIIVSAHQPQAVFLGDLSFEVTGWGINPILDAATPHVNLAVRLRTLSAHPDVEGLRLLVANEVKAFEQKLDGLDYDRATILAARYALCSMIDEAALASPWGSVWSAKSLLSQFYNETWGGEKFYLILARLLQEPAKNIEMIEFLYVCLRLGFKGKYAVIENGAAKLDILSENVRDVLRRLRKEEADDLADHWRVGLHRQPRLTHWLSLRIAIGLTVALLVTGYFWLNAGVETEVEPIKYKFENIIVGGRV